MRKRGFTLIELLVVVAIIALLIAILLPSLGRAKANGVRVKCGAQLRQWGNIITMYAQENNDYFGLEWKDAQNNKHDWTGIGVGATPTLYDPEWASFAAQGRLQTQEYRTCPGDPVFGQVAGSGVAGGKLLGNANVGSRPPIDYAMVRYMPVLANQSLMYRTDDFNHPGTTLLMCDSPSNPRGLNVLADISTMADLNQTTSFQGVLEARHAGIGNVLFLDSHVEQHNYQDFVNNIPSVTGPGGNAPAAESGKVWTTKASN